MSTHYGNRLTELPTFLSTASIFGAGAAEAISKLRRAENKSPAFYEPTRQLWLRVLAGDFSFGDAMAQAELLSDNTERECAIQVLDSSRHFLSSQQPARVDPLPSMKLEIGIGPKVAVTPVWIRHLPQERILALHFWRTPLSDYQMSAAAAMLQLGLIKNQTHLARCELDFVTVSIPDYAAGRRFRRFDWASVKPLPDVELDRFFERVRNIWSEYQSQKPSARRIRHGPDLFDR